MMVQGLGHHGFASPRFTAQQYGGAGISHPVDHIKDLLHTRRVANDLLYPVFPGKFSF